MAPASVWPCLFVGLSGLYYLYSKTTSGPQAFVAGFFFAIGYFVTGLWWIGNALLVEGNEFAWVWPISVIGLPTLLALFTGTYLGMARMLARPNSLRGFMAFAFFLTVSEWARGSAFTGFPWNLYGYTWADTLPMAQSAHYIGAYGLTLATVLWASALGFQYVWQTKRNHKIIFTGVVAASLIATYLLGDLRLKSNETTFDSSNLVAVVQPNIPQNMKWDTDVIQGNFIKTLSLSQGATTDDPAIENILIVWPETALSPAVYTRDDNMQKLGEFLNTYKSASAYLITGILRRDVTESGDMDYGNSVVVMDKNLTPLNIYDKHHLVPFGEFIPFQDWIPLTPVAAFKGFTPGPGASTIEVQSIPPFSPLICYEVIFPDDVVNKTAQTKPKWIVNVTNDGWYGDSAGPYQHFAQSRMRAIEEGLPLIRSANTGISGIIDPYGRIVDQADIFQEAILISRLPESIGGKNPWWPWLFQAFLFIGAITMATRLVTKGL